ncbi:MAG TPA: hypothetical protein VFC74_08825 [Oscillospiraceae bacterium]|nr:hypothetical protein [Oscillospiraceae bacterium]
MKYEGIDNWVSIFEAATWEEATMAKGMLEAAKIPVILDRDSLGDGYSMSASVMNEVVVKVPKQMVTKAAQLLQTKSFGASGD